jgi:hypothetical protein
MKHNNTLVASSEPFQAWGAAYTDEHLYVIAEPQEITERTQLNLVAIVTNNAHPLWVVPSLRVWAQGTSDTPSGISTSSLQSALIAGQRDTDKGVRSVWPIETNASPVLWSEPALGYGVDTQAFYSGPILTASPNVAALHEHNTMLIGPFGLYVTPPFTADAKLMPGTNEEGAFNFYIDNQRNMYSFENVHSLDLQTFEPGPAVASTPVSGQLSLGVTSHPGDLNGDGMVNMADITPIATYFWSIDPNHVSQVDQNGDGEISIIEMLYLVTYFGSNYY